MTNCQIDAPGTLNSIGENAVILHRKLASPFVFTVKERRVQPCVISCHCRCEAIAIAYEEWDKLSRVPRFGRLLMAAPLEAGDLPKRNRKPIAICATSRNSGVRAHDLFEALPQSF